MKKTDYLVGIHGAGLCLSVFLSNKSILHEIISKKEISVVSLMSALSGHITYSDLIRNKMNINDGNENIIFEPNTFAKHVLIHMIQNNFHKYLIYFLK